MLADLMKFWPVIFLILNLLTVWICWSLRQLAKNEVKVIVDASTQPLGTRVAEVERVQQVHHDSINRHDGRLDNLADDVASLPTKADLERVVGKVEAVGDRVGVVNDGVKRLEGYFLAEGVGALR
ncbi:hypothetical protein BH10PSE5_BH10PSE5_01380 [soil metagenome]